MIAAFFPPGSLRLVSWISAGFECIVLFCENDICLFNFPILFCSLEEQLTSVAVDYICKFEVVKNCNTILDFLE